MANIRSTLLIPLFSVIMVIRDELSKNRSFRKIDSQRLFSREYDFPKTFSLTENRFYGKTYFYTIASRMGEIVEACLDPPPCLGAVCACAGGGMAGSAMQIISPYCVPYIEPCTNSAELCTQCYTESGCAGGSKSGRRKGKTTCERKNNAIECHPGDKQR